MTKRVQRVRHESVDADLFVGLVGELTIDLTNNNIRVHDGTTAGGHVVPPLSYIQANFAVRNDNYVVFNATQTIFNQPQVDRDFIIDALALPNAFFLDGTNGNVTIAGTLTVTGGIPGVQPSDALLTAISALVTSADQLMYFTGIDAVAQTPLTAFARTFLDDANAAAVLATIGAQALDSDLTAIAALSATGIAVQTAVGAWANRSLAAPAAGITITNPAGIAGNITLVLANDLAALEALGSTGFAVRTAADTWAQRSLANGTGIAAITNPAGVAGNPIIAIDTAVVPQLNVANNFTATGNTFSANTAGAGFDPVLNIDRNKGAAGTANDFLGQIKFAGRNSANAFFEFSSIASQLLDPTAGSEDGRLLLFTPVAGTGDIRAYVGAGVYSKNATGGDPGVDAINFKRFLQDNVLLNANQWAKNKVINGSFQIWQRGAGGSASIAVPASTGYQYTADRWALFTNANQAYTVSQQAGFGISRYCARVQRNNGQTGTLGVLFQYSFETHQIVPLSGKTVTIYALCRAGANYSAASGALQCQLRTGTGAETKSVGGFTSPQNDILFTNNMTAGGAAVVFKGTATLRAGITQAALYFTSTPVGTAGVNDYYEITDVMIEIAPDASEFVPTPFDIDLQQCMRYYWKSFAYATAPAQNAGDLNSLGAPAIVAGAASNRISLIRPVRMRVAPTNTYYNPSAANGQMRDNTGSLDCTGTAANANDGESTIAIFATGNAGTVVNNRLAIHISCDAEL